jgi:hypothetical protein
LDDRVKRQLDDVDAPPPHKEAVDRSRSGEMRTAAGRANAASVSSSNETSAKVVPSAGAAVSQLPPAKTASEVTDEMRLLFDKDNNEYALEVCCRAPIHQKNLFLVCCPFRASVGTGPVLACLPQLLQLPTQNSRLV